MPLIFYIGIAVWDGPVWCVDSQSYVSMDFSREPVYPLFLMLIRRIYETFDFSGQMYGQDSYLFCAVIIQSLLWVFASWRLGMEIFNTAIRNLPEKKAVFLGYCGVLSQMAVASLNRFAANRGSMYSECIMTEALAMPLFILFNIELWKLYRSYIQRNIVSVFLLGVLIASIRKQMLICLIIWGFSAFVIYLLEHNREGLHKLFITVLMIFAAIVCISGIDRFYNSAVRGRFVEHIGNSKGGLDTVLYTAKSEDAELFADYNGYPDLDKLYTDIYETCKEQQLTIEFAPGYDPESKPNVFTSDWVAMASHYADSYDVIGFDVVAVKCDEYVKEHFPDLELYDAQLKEDEIEGILLKTLLKKDFDRITKGEGGTVIYVFTANVLKAFVISVANISPKILIQISMFIYVLYLTAFGFLYMSNVFGSGGQSKSMKSEFMILAFLTLSGIAINSVVTGSMIFPQPRYMCYGMGLFYLTLTCDIIATKK
ncbi:MAG: hypothetical protein J5802_03605 [Butyrivibrio sp.]|nr:hypothetical protein [Butyrivibrio sp.]